MDAATDVAAAAVRVLVLHRRTVAKGGVAALRAHAASASASAAAGAAPAGELMVWRAARRAWEPLTDAAALPRCASLRLAAA
jgi:hypothetical protein